MNIKIAWRNIRRNKKRSLIAISSVVLAVVTATFVRSLQEGSYKLMIENAAGKFSGYIQVQNKDYWNDKSVDNGITVSSGLTDTVLSVRGVKSVNKRLESFVLASFRKNTKGTFISGIEPEKENLMSGLKEKIISGEYLEKDDKAVLLGSKLAKYLGVSVGDSLVLLGQGHWGNSAAGIFPVKGIVKLPIPNLDRQTVYIPLKTAQKLFSFPDGITSLVVIIDKPEKTSEICENLNSKFKNTEYKALTWKEMFPEMLQQIQSDRVSGIIMLYILYMIIAFGIFGTVLMMTQERKREFAVMTALGMQKTKLAAITVYESFIINITGIIIGIALSLPPVVFFHFNPIEITGEAAKSIEKFGMEPLLPTVIDIKIILTQTLTVLSIAAFAVIYPVFLILKLDIIRNLRR